MSIGARSQSAKTYLEKHFESFADASLESLILHGLRSLRDTLQQDKELSVANCSLAFVGPETDFNIVEGDKLQVYVQFQLPLIFSLT